MFRHQVVSDTLWTTPGLFSLLFVKVENHHNYCFTFRLKTSRIKCSCRKVVREKLFLPACESEKFSFCRNLRPGKMPAFVSFIMCVKFIHQLYHLQCRYHTCMGVYYKQCVHVSAVSAMYHTAACTLYVLCCKQCSTLIYVADAVCTSKCIYVYTCIYIYTYTYIHLLRGVQVSYMQLMPGADGCWQPITTQEPLSSLSSSSSP